MKRQAYCIVHESLPLHPLQALEPPDRKLKNMARRLLLMLACLLVLPAVFAAGFAFRSLTGKSAPKEWTLPAQFEGQGAVTVGCAFWTVPQMRPYDGQNDNTGFVNLNSTGESGTVQTILMIDGPRGTTTIGGDKCAVSVDWNAFPQTQR